jgi:hypothetical protein
MASAFLTDAEVNYVLISITHKTHASRVKVLSIQLQVIANVFVTT